MHIAQIKVSKFVQRQRTKGCGIGQYDLVSDGSEHLEGRAL